MALITTSASARRPGMAVATEDRMEDPMVVATAVVMAAAIGITGITAITETETAIVDPMAGVTVGPIEAATVGGNADGDVSNADEALGEIRGRTLADKRCGAM